MFKFACAILAAATLAAPASSQTLERIKETGELKLGYRADAAPMSFAGEGGQPSGYTPQVCVSIAQGITNHLKMDDLQVIFVEVDTSDRFEKVVSGEIDLLCGAATITLDRRELVDFSVPTYVDGTALLVPIDSNGDLASFGGKKVGVRAGTTTFDALTSSLADVGIDADIVAFDDHDAGLKALETKQIAAYFADQSILLNLYIKSEFQSQLKLSEEILTIEKQGLAMARGDADFRLVVDAALSGMFFDGTMEQIFTNTLPGVTPGFAIRAMHLLSPTH